MKTGHKSAIATAITVALLAFSGSASAASEWDPVITAPSNNATTTGSVTVTFTLQTNSASLPYLTFRNGSAWTKLTLGGANRLAGSHSVTINLKTVTRTGGVTRIDTNAASDILSTSLADANYSITVSADDNYFAYYGYGLNTVYESAPVTGLTVDSVTQAGTMTQPVGSRTNTTIPIAFSIPETPKAGTVQLHIGGALNCDITLATPAANTTVSLNLDPSNLSGSGTNGCASNSLPDGTIPFSVKYQDSLGNPAATSSSASAVLDRVTTTPTLTSPVSSNRYGHSMSISYTLPEAASSGTITFTSSGATRVLNLSAAGMTSGSHTKTIDPASISSDPTFYGSTTGGSSIPDGTYSVTVRYQDSLGNPVASAAGSSGVIVDTVTETPTLTTPSTGLATTSDGTLSIDYTLPEVALSNSVQLTLTGSLTYTLVLSPGLNGNHTLSFKISDPVGTSSGAVTSITNGPSIAEGTYSVALSYSDLVGNTRAASTLATGVVLDTATLPVTLTSPTTSSAASGLPVSYTLPEAPKAGSVVLHLTGAATRDITLGNSISASFTLPGTATSSDSNVVSMSGGTDIPDGVYNVSLSYQDLYSHTQVTSLVKTNVTVDTVTDAPSLTTPLADTSTKQVAVSYSLPEAAKADSVKVVFTGAASRTVTLSEKAAGAHNISLNPADLSGTGITSTSGGTSLPDGTYSVNLTYQDWLGNPLTAATARTITIDTDTQKPTLTSPSPSQRLSPDNASFSYRLPEAAQAGSVKLTLHSTTGAGDWVITLSNSSQGDGVVALRTVNPAGSTGVAGSSPATSIPNGVYDAQISYQDALGNPAKSDGVTGIILGEAPPLPRTTIGFVKPKGGKLKVAKNQTAIAVNFNGAGTVSIAVKSAKGALLGTGVIKFTKAGKGTIKLALNAAGKKALKKAKKAGVKVTLTATGTASGHTSGKAVLAVKLTP